MAEEEGPIAKEIEAASEADVAEDIKAMEDASLSEGSSDEDAEESRDEPIGRKTKPEVVVAKVVVPPRRHKNKKHRGPSTPRLTQMRRLFLLCGVLETTKRAKVKVAHTYRALVKALCKHIALQLSLNKTQTVKPVLAIRACNHVLGGRFYQ